ncbi:MAG TPA: hypothetical protein VME43_03295 [Bryobacteraceae bacterium]|nr:hypothetical protein [Bryobacteraceae bacterium]
MSATLHERVLALEKTALRHDKQMSRHDKQIEVIRNLVREGIRIVVQNAKEQRELRVAVRELTNSLKRGSNGHAKGKVDLQ